MTSLNCQWFASTQLKARELHNEHIVDSYESNTVVFYVRSVEIPLCLGHQWDHRTCISWL